MSSFSFGLENFVEARNDGFGLSRADDTPSFPTYLEGFGNERQPSGWTDSFDGGLKPADFGGNSKSTTPETASSSTIQPQQRGKKRSFGEESTGVNPHSSNPRKKPRHLEPTPLCEPTGVDWNTAPPSTYRGGISMGGKSAPIQATALYNVQSQRKRTLNLRRGEIVTLLKVNCWSGVNETGVEGVFREEQVRFLDRRDHTQGARALTHSPRSGDKELFFLKGEFITNIDIIWWKAQNERGDMGYVPSRCVKVMKDEHSSGRRQQAAGQGEIGSALLRDPHRLGFERQKELYSSHRSTKECVACGEVWSNKQFADNVTTKCKHENRICRNCVQQWIASQLETTSWDRIKCPGRCRENLQPGDVQQHATQQTFKR